MNRDIPYDLQIEKNIIGSIILDSYNLDVVKDIIREEDFYDKRNAIIFSHLMKLDKPDVLVLSNSLKSSNELDLVGGQIYLLEVCDNTITINNLEKQCNVLKELSIKRQIIKRLNNILEDCCSDKKVDELLEETNKITYDIGLSNVNMDFLNFKDLVQDVVNEVAEMKDKDLSGLSTGFENLDEMTTGMHGGDYILLAARPSMGKTAFALNIAQNVAFRENKNVIVFSLEMSAKQLMYRVVASEAEVDMKGLKTGYLYKDEWEKLYNGVNELLGQEEQRLFIEDDSMLTIGDMRRKCKKLKIEKGLDLIVIDYLQLINSKEKSESRTQEVSSLSRQLKALAKELDCPVIVLSQLSRSPESRINKRPIMSDLRESGSIEQDADIVMMLYRDEYYNKDTQDDFTELIIAKQRNGEIGTVQLFFDKERSKFLDY